MEKVPRGGSFSIQQIILQILGTFNRAFWSWNWYKIVISGFRVCFFNNCIEKNQNKTNIEEGSSSHTIFWLFRSNKGWIRATKVWQHEYQWSFRWLEVSLPEFDYVLQRHQLLCFFLFFFYFSACACAIKHSISTHLFWSYTIIANN